VTDRIHQESASVYDLSTQISSYCCSRSMHATLGLLDLHGCRSTFVLCLLCFTCRSTICSCTDGACTPIHSQLGTEAAAVRCTNKMLVWSFQLTQIIKTTHLCTFPCCAVSFPEKRVHRRRIKKGSEKICPRKKLHGTRSRERRRI
jgi:hypothetical protein